VSKRKVSVKHMFYNPEDVKFFKVRKNATQFLKSLLFFQDELDKIDINLFSVITLMRFLNAGGNCSL